MKTVIIGAGLPGLVCSHVSNYTALVLDSREKLASNLGEMSGTRFVADLPEMRKLFDYTGPSEKVIVTYDEDDKDIALEHYVRKTRKCDLYDIPDYQRPSVAEWGQGSFDRLPINVNLWAEAAAKRAGVVFDSWIEKVERNDGQSELILPNGSVAADKVIFTIPLPLMMRVAGIPGWEKFRTSTVTIGRYQVGERRDEALPTTIHHVTSPASPVSRIITYDRFIIVEAPSEQEPKLLATMMEAAEERAELLHGRGPLKALAFPMFHHYFNYFAGFEEARRKALAALEGMGLYGLGRHARFDHSARLTETYRQALQMVSM